MRDPKDVRAPNPTPCLGFRVQGLGFRVAQGIVTGIHLRNCSLGVGSAGVGLPISADHKPYTLPSWKPLIGFGALIKPQTLNRKRCSPKPIFNLKPYRVLGFRVLGSPGFLWIEAGGFGALLFRVALPRLQGLLL